MPETYDPIATTTLGSNASSITLSSIPSTYTDLRMVVVGRPSANFPGLRFQINSDTSTTVYTGVMLQGNGSSIESLNHTGEDHLLLSSASNPNFWFISITDFTNYAGSTNKTMLTENYYDRNGSGNMQRFVQRYASTSAISSLYLYTSSDSFLAGTNVTLYGITRA